MKNKYICENTICGSRCECATEHDPEFCLHAHPDYARKKFQFQSADWRLESELDNNHVMIDDIVYEAVPAVSCAFCAFDFGGEKCSTVLCYHSVRHDGRSVIWQRVKSVKYPLRITIDVENRW